MNGLTDRQDSVLGFLRSFVAAHGYPPTMREIGERFGFSWPAARGHLKALEKKGLIKINPFKSRGIELAGAPDISSIPIAGAIRAGDLMPAIEDLSARIVVDREMFRDSGAFALRVEGQSMIEAGILDGDFVVVGPGREVRDGEIGVALIEDEATVKKISREAGVVTLSPCNSTLSPRQYPARDVSIIGRVIGVIRKI